MSVQFEHPAAPMQPAVAAGCVVRLEDLDDLSLLELTIVSAEEADPEANQISSECPIGEALLGRLAGDLVTVDIPAGRVRYRVVSVD